MPPPMRASRARRDTMSMAGPRPLIMLLTCHLAVLFILIIICCLLLVSDFDWPYCVGVRPAAPNRPCPCCLLVVSLPCSTGFALHALQPRNGSSCPCCLLTDEH